MKFWPCILPANSPHSTRDLCPEYIGCFQRSLGPNGWGNVTLGGRIFNSVFRCLGANVINKGGNWGNSGLGIGETPPLQTVANSINRTNGSTVMLRAEERRCCMDWRDNVLLYVRVWMQCHGRCRIGCEMEISKWWVTDKQTRRQIFDCYLLPLCVCICVCVFVRLNKNGQASNGKATSKSPLPASMAIG